MKLSGIIFIFCLLLIPVLLFARQAESNCSIVGISGFYAYNDDDPAYEINIFYSFWGWHTPRSFIKKISLNVDNGMRFRNMNNHYYKVSYDIGIYPLEKTPLALSIGGVHYSAEIKKPDVTSGLSLGVLYTPLVHVGVRYLFNQKAPVEFFAGFRFHLYSIDYNTGDWKRVL